MSQSTETQDTKAITARRCRSLRHVIGNTPIMALRCRMHGEERTVYAKYEVRNLTGSIKDRMALRILERAHAAGEISAGDRIVEATSGNTGIAFAAVGRALGHDVRIYMPDWMSMERVDLIRSFGAEIIPVSRADGGFVGCIELAETYARENENAFLPRQFDNEANVYAHEMTTGPEIVDQLRAEELIPTGFVAGVGTGGTVMGVGRHLRKATPGASVHPLEPANSPTLSEGHKVGSHRIQGISDDFIPSIVDLSSLDSIVDTWDGDAILMAQRMARELGIAVGISSGANVIGALKIALEQGPDSVVVTVLPDSNKKYLSTDLCREEPVRPEYLTPNVELLGCHVIPPVCDLHGDPGVTRVTA
jgi:cysteine synthase A